MAVASVPVYQYKKGAVSIEDTLLSLERIKRPVGTNVECWFDYDSGNGIKRYKADIPESVIKYIISKSDDNGISLNLLKRNNSPVTGTQVFNSKDILYGYNHDTTGSLILVFEKGQVVRYHVVENLDQITAIQLSKSTSYGNVFTEGNYLYMIATARVIDDFTSGDMRISAGANGFLMETYDGTNWQTTENQI